MPSFTLPLVKARFEWGVLYLQYEHIFMKHVVCVSQSRIWDRQPAVGWDEWRPYNHWPAQLYLPGCQRNGFSSFQKCKFGWKSFCFPHVCNLTFPQLPLALMAGCGFCTVVYMVAAVQTKEGTEEISGCMISSPVKVAKPTQERGQRLNIVRDGITRQDHAVARSYSFSFIVIILK